MFSSNVGMTDRALRAAIGTVLLGYAIWYHDAPYAWLGWIGIVPLATGMLGWCGLYRLFGISTRRVSP